MRSGRWRVQALALVLLRRHHGTGTEKECLAELLRVRPVAAPNLAIVQHGDALLGCGGALVQIVKNDPEVTRRRAEAGVTVTISGISLRLLEHNRHQRRGVDSDHRSSPSSS